MALERYRSVFVGRNFSVHLSVCSLFRIFPIATPLHTKVSSCFQQIYSGSKTVNTTVPALALCLSTNSCFSYCSRTQGEPTPVVATLLVDIGVVVFLADSNSLVSELNINEEVSPRARLIYILDHP